LWKLRITIKIISRTKKRNKYFFYELYTGTHRVRGRRNTRRANIRIRGRKKGTNRRKKSIRKYF